MGQGEKKKGEHLRQASVLRFKDRVPSKLGRAARGDDLAVRATLEENGLRPGTGAVRKSAKCPSGARREAVQHTIETFTFDRSVARLRFLTSWIFFYFHFQVIKKG